jgi:hypothetical protein
MNNAFVHYISGAAARWSTAAKKSPYKKIWDFSYSYLLPALGLDPDKKIPLGDTKGGFIIFPNAYPGLKERAFNINDAGNWLWGQAMQRIGMDAENALWAADINSRIAGDGYDSDSDQSAIYEGWNTKVLTSEAVAHRIFLAPSIQKNANHPKQKGE